jgi:predicted lipoprotein with Yx(FWY)xxD motif
MESTTMFKRIGAGIGIGAVSASLGQLGVLPMATAGATATVVGTHAGKAAVVVKIAKSRAGFKNVLTTTKGVGATLYTASSCSRGCLSVWPPLLMPSGTTLPKGPKGLTGLGTIKFGTRRQVTYLKHPLYTFTGDSGASVSGNGVAGFKVIKNA